MGLVQRNIIRIQARRFAGLGGLGLARVGVAAWPAVLLGDQGSDAHGDGHE